MDEFDHNEESGPSSATSASSGTKFDNSIMKLGSSTSKDIIIPFESMQDIQFPIPSLQDIALLQLGSKPQKYHSSLTSGANISNITVGSKVSPPDDQFSRSNRIQTGTVINIKPAAQRRHRRWKAFQQAPIAGRATESRKLHTAVGRESIPEVEELLESGTNPSLEDGKRRTPLHIAAARGNLDLVNVLISHGADPNKRDVIGNTPLHLATITSKVDVVTRLLQAGTDVGALDASGRTPLHLAHSRLRRLMSDPHRPPQDLKQHTSQVLVMLQQYLGRRGDDVTRLNTIEASLPAAHSRAQVEEVTSLLADFASLQLGGGAPV